MAIKLVTASKNMKPPVYCLSGPIRIDLMSPEAHAKSMDDIITESFQESFFNRYGTVITTSMMMSQTAADKHAVIGTLLRLNRFSLLCCGNPDRMCGVMKRIVKRRNYHYLSLFVDYVGRGLDYGYSELDSVLRGQRAVEGIYKNDTCDGALPSQHSQHAFAVAVAAVLHLLAFVLQYLIGYIDRGGTKTYSSGCFDFRASFVSVLLFLAAFLWIKFRQAARPSTGKRKQPEDPIDDANDPSHVYPRKYGSVTKYEARFTIPVNMRDEAHPVKHPRLTLGEHESPEVAAFVWRVAETCYEGQRGSCCVTLQGEPYTFPVPAMSEQERGLVGEEKRQWVMTYAKDVGKKEYEKYAKQPAPATGTGSHDRSPSRRTCQPSLMLANTADEPLSESEAPSCSVTLLPAYEDTVREETVREEINADAQHFQAQHQGSTQNLEGLVFTEGVEPQWPEELPPSDGLPTEYSFEEFMGILGESSPSDPPFELESTLNRNMPSSDSGVLEHDSSPLFGAEAGAVEHPQVWSVQNFQQMRDAGDAVVQYAERTGSGPLVVEQVSELTVTTQQQQRQVFSLQSWEAEHLQGAEPSQQLSDRSGEPSESIPQQYERLLKDNERLRKEKELCEQKNERVLRDYERLLKENEFFEQENERLVKEKELAEQDKERWRDKYEGLEHSIVALARKSVLSLAHD